MTPLEKVNSMRMPFAELKGVIFTEAERDASSRGCWSAPTSVR